MKLHYIQEKKQSEKKNEESRAIRKLNEAITARFLAEKDVWER